MKDDEIKSQDAIGDLAYFVQGFFLFESIDQIDSSEEARFFTMMRNGLDRQSCCNISFACPGTSNEHDVVSIIDERAGV